MKKVIKNITATVVTAVMITGFAQAQERSFKTSVPESNMIKVMSQSIQSDGWDVVKKSEDTHFTLSKAYTKRVIMNRKPMKRVEGNVFVEVSFTKDGYTLKAVNEEGKAQNNLGYKEGKLFSGLKAEIEKQLASALI